MRESKQQRDRICDKCGEVFNVTSAEIKQHAAECVGKEVQAQAQA